MSKKSEVDVVKIIQRHFPEATATNKLYDLGYDMYDIFGRCVLIEADLCIKLQMKRILDRNFTFQAFIDEIIGQYNTGGNQWKS